MDDKLLFIQFLHPGGEHKPDDGCKCWNRNAHKRKFMRQEGKYIADADGENSEIVFWGEWEPESKAERIDKPIKKHGPQYIYKPYYVVPESYEGLQNTDPFVFGEHFLYTVCLQPHFPQLRHLSKGSVILFGSCKHHAFVLDTVFVVDRWIDHSRANFREVLAGAVPREYMEVTILPLYQEPCAETWSCAAADSQETWRLYFGVSHKRRLQGMYSFFPCQPYEVKPRGFARPKISLSEIADKKNIGIKRTYLESLDDMKLLWDRVVEQVIKDRQHLALGVHAKMPVRCVVNE